MSERAEQPIVVHPPSLHANTAEDGAGPGTDTLLDLTLARTGADVELPRRAETLDSPTGPAPSRSIALDAFRGLLMIAMVFSFAILGKAGLPAWMYHMQFPPPAERFTPLPGLTWRDLIFPGFLFTMAAAIPLASSRLLAAGMAYPEIIWRGLKRAALLFGFALIIGHTNPYWTNDYTKLGNVMAIVGFLACWPVLLSRRSDWSPARFRIFKLVGLVAVAALLFALPWAYDRSFSLFRKDNIIHALAFVGITTLIIWLFTRTNLQARLAVLATIVALKLGASQPGWLHEAWLTKSWLLEPWFIELLILTILGSIAGDLLVSWLAHGRDEDQAGWPRPRLAVLAMVSIAVTPLLLVGLYTRAVGLTTLGVIGVAALGVALVHAPVAPADRVLAMLWRWGGALLILGMLLEPFEGGIKKDPQTLSFLVLMAGVCFVSLAALLIIADRLNVTRRTTRVLAETGRNPLLMYVLFSLFINHIAYLVEVGDYFTVGIGPALARATAFTALTTAVVVWLTRRRVFWKA